MLEQICIPVQSELEKVELCLSNELTSGLPLIDQIAHYVIKNGGKRIRPLIFLLASRVAGCHNSDIPRLAAAIEMLHTASLLHDDVVDNATVRRGRPSASARWGNQVSVLVGDLLLCRASQIMVEAGNEYLMKESIKSITETTNGELLEITHQNDVAVTEEIYMSIIRGKTAALFSLAGKAAGIVGDISDTFTIALEEFGLFVGMAFQLADDALDYVADESRMGKKAGIDLHEGKLTYPLISTMKKAGKEEQIIIRNTIIAGVTGDNEFRAISAIIDRHGGITATWQLAHDYSRRAKEALAPFKPSIERDSLMMLADYVVERDR